MKKSPGSRNLLHVVDREAKNTRLVVELTKGWLLTLKVQQYAGFNWKDAASVTVSAGDLFSAVGRHRALMEQQLIEWPVATATGLERETGPRPADGSVQQAIASDAQGSSTNDGNESENMG